MHDSIDLLLTMQNPGGGFASYETINGPALLELINPAEVFGDIMIEYAYPECTTSVVTALLKFTKIDDYRKDDISKCVDSAVKYILRAQRDDGSWFGSWAICFTYATMFAVESLMLAGHTYDNSEAIRKACKFLESKQMHDGGWGETYKVSLQDHDCKADQTGELTSSLFRFHCNLFAVVRNGSIYTCEQVASGANSLGDHHTATRQISPKGPHQESRQSHHGSSTCRWFMGARTDRRHFQQVWNHTVGDS